MSEQNAYEQLGVGENASFEEIQDAKKRLIQQHSSDSKKVESIESAYDTIIMDRLRLRQEGKIKVPERIRFPERAPEAPSKLTTNVSSQNSANWLQQFIDNPSQADILLPTGIFLVLASIAVFAQTPAQSPLPLLMALGFMANIYFLNRKEGRFGRAFLMSLVALFVGIGLGSGLAQLMVSQGGVVLGAEKLASTITFCLFWLASCFLR
ncbi:MAG: CPP1-like family protein [Xenococcaceae cyanobacterium MO_188.B29]|nr:CPP1-like family protein [Xenococcaceae cyanobacterium MO_188.B29]